MFKEINNNSHIAPCFSYKGCTALIFSVTAIAGGVIVTLAALQLFGGVNSIGFIVGLAGGGGTLIVSGAIVFTIMIAKWTQKKESDRVPELQNRPTPELQNRPTIEFDPDASIETINAQLDELIEERGYIPSEWFELLLQKSPRDESGKLIDSNAVIERIKHTSSTDSDSKRNTALHHAVAYEDDVELVAAFLERGGPNINWTNNEIDTPLHIAIKNKHVNVALLLIDRGADTTQINIETLTPLHMAAKLQCGGGIITRICQNDERAISTKTREADTALHLAVKNMKNSDETVPVLNEILENIRKFEEKNKNEEHIPLIEEFNNNFETALILASKLESDQKEVVIKILLDEGADPRFIDNQENSALDYSPNSVSLNQHAERVKQKI